MERAQELPFPLLFISYAKEDRDRVIDLVITLESAGYHVWLDQKDLLPGQDWQQEIEIAIEESDFVIICLSKTTSTKTGFVQKEIKHAYEQATLRPERQTYIIPVRLELCDVPRKLRNIQYVDLFNPDGHSQLLYALKLHTDARPLVMGAKKNYQKISEHKGLIATEWNFDTYLLVERLGLEDWEKRFSPRLKSPVAILGCLVPFEVRALHLVREVCTNGKYGTFSAILTKDGNAWLSKMLAFGIVNQLSRNTNPASGMENLVTLTLTELGRQVLDANETIPLSQLALPKELWELSHFDLIITNLLNWHNELSDRLIRLKKRHFLRDVLHPLIQFDLYRMEHESKRFFTIGTSPLAYRISNVYPIFESNKSVRRYPKLDSITYSLLEELRRDFQREHDDDFIVASKSIKSYPKASFDLLSDLDIVAFKRIRGSILCAINTLGLSILDDGSIEKDEYDYPVAELWSAIRPPDE